MKKRQALKLCKLQRSKGRILHSHKLSTIRESNRLLGKWLSYEQVYKMITGRDLGLIRGGR